MLDFNCKKQALAGSPGVLKKRPKWNFLQTTPRAEVVPF